MTIFAKPFDVEAIRRDFPILARTVHGKPLVYLDNAASAQKPQAVIDGEVGAYSNIYANVHRGLHFLSNAATDAYEAAREKVRAFLNAPSVDEVIFTKSVTESINVVAHGYALATLREGDEIVLSQMEHHSNIVPWHFARERNGAVIRWIPVNDLGFFTIEDFKAQLTERTKIVAVTHMSNVLGTVNPVAEIARICRERGLLCFIDGAQGAVHLDVDVQAIGCDFYAFTGHKLYGPSGIGVLWGRKELLETMRPFMGGGEMILEVTEETVTYNHAPHRFEAGTPPIVQAIGLGAAIDYVNAIGRDAIHAHEAALGRYTRERLSAINALRIIGDAPGKGAIFSFELAGIHAHDVSMLIDRSGVAVRAGTHCAQPLMARFGVTSTCRASFALYNTFAEVDALAEALEKARRFFA
jgi:cysteine desulfurase / selenocysteine lyase